MLAIDRCREDTYLTGDGLGRDLLAQQTDLEAATVHQSQYFTVDLFGQFSGGRQKQRADAIVARCLEVRHGGNNAEENGTAEKRNEHAHKEQFQSAKRENSYARIRNIFPSIVTSYLQCRGLSGSSGSTSQDVSARQYRRNGLHLNRRGFLPIRILDVLYNNWLEILLNIHGVECSAGLGDLLAFDFDLHSVSECIDLVVLFQRYAFVFFLEVTFTSIITLLTFVLAFFVVALAFIARCCRSDTK